MEEPEPKPKRLHMYPIVAHLTENDVRYIRKAVKRYQSGYPKGHNQWNIGRRVLNRFQKP